MRNSQRPCHLIQEDIACNRKLSQEDNQHVLACSSCSDVAAKVKELDSFVRKVIDQEPPHEFAEKVVAKILEDESRANNPYSQWIPLLERIAYSRAVQWVLVGIGSVFGLFKIFRFFLVHGFK
jgi:hypothetical protein